MKSIDLEDIFGEDGIFAEIIPGYEHRSEQLKLAEFVQERLYSPNNGLIEAGTGTGKTIAYLVPLLLYAIKEDKKVAISTETKTLQKQIIDKDLPLVKKLFSKHLELDFSYSLCLGGGNYPCEKRYHSGINKGLFTEKELKKLEGLNNLFSRKKIFTRFDLHLPEYLWTQINRDSEGCNVSQCLYASACPFQKARREWQKSDLLVMNHYLFFSDIKAGKVLLPRTDVVLFDEAHSVETISSVQAGFKRSLNQLTDLLSLFYRKEKSSGLIQNISKSSTRKKSIEALENIRFEAQDYFEGLRRLFPDGKSHYRIEDTKTENRTLLQYFKEAPFLQEETDSLLGDDDANDDTLMTYDIARGKLLQYFHDLSLFMTRSKENYVYWIEKREGKLLSDIYICAQPVRVADYFRDEVLQYYESTILISATLTIANEFSYITETLGMIDFKSLSLQSSFDYQSQLTLFLPKSLPEQSSPSFLEEASVLAHKLIDHMKGNCLILFTSYRMLRELKELLEDRIDYPIYSQDSMSAAEAIERYLQDDNSILMGTHSFWQGIDLPGDLLRGVIMMKLPFSVPGLPLIEAKSDYLKQAGKNPFYSLQVPEAVIKFRQGFGRLIRSRQDRGIVAIFDRRITSKGYGSVFIKSLPSCRVVSAIDELFDTEK